MNTINNISQVPLKGREFSPLLNLYDSFKDLSNAMVLQWGRGANLVVSNKPGSDSMFCNIIADALIDC